ncbi:MAG: hypothetical protein ACJ8EJ_12505 [Xanthobacteraceae bacterium]|jgi:voltage-gated potassium channel Kch
MKTLIAAAALATLLAFPAFAQSYDPDLGTGNIVSWSDSAVSAKHVPQRGHGSFARVVPGGAATTAYGAVTPFGAPVRGQNGGAHSSTTREQALRECSTAAAPYKSTTWGHMELHQYRTCMAQHGQAE